jgi:hypothetical protein
MAFALLGLALCHIGWGAETQLESKAPDIHVNPAGFGKVSAKDITTVLKSATSEIWKHCPGAELSGINVYHRSDHPRTNFAREPNGRIAIALTAKNTYWAQYSFQVAHEFCHVLANFSNKPNRLVRYPRHSNFWLEESLCETASLFTLRAMSRSWQVAPPYPAFQRYAPWLNSYAEQRLAAREHQLPAGTSFLAWFQETERALRENATIRDRNTLIAIQLLPLFEKDPRGWKALIFLNHGLPHGNQSLAQHLAEWRSRCPRELRPFLSRLAAVFGVKL